MPAETTKKKRVEFYFYFDRLGSKNLLMEFLWMLRHGEWNACWYRRQLVFGGGRLWHDGPHWFVQLGLFGVSVS